MNPANGFKKGVSGNPSGRPKAAMDYLEKQLMPSLKKMVELRDNAEDQDLQGKMADKLADKVLGTNMNVTGNINVVVKDFSNAEVVKK